MEQYFVSIKHKDKSYGDFLTEKEKDSFLAGLHSNPDLIFCIDFKKCKVILPRYILLESVIEITEHQ